MRLGVKMAQQSIIEIAEFPHDNRLWRIDYLGAIMPELQCNNMMIGVVLHPVSDSTIEKFSQYNTISKILTLDNLDINREQARFINSNDEINYAYTQTHTDNKDKP